MLFLKFGLALDHHRGGYYEEGEHRSGGCGYSYWEVIQIAMVKVAVIMGIMDKGAMDREEVDMAIREVETGIKEVDMGTEKGEHSPERSVYDSYGSAKTRDIVME